MWNAETNPLGEAMVQKNACEFEWCYEESVLGEEHGNWFSIINVKIIMSPTMVTLWANSNKQV